MTEGSVLIGQRLGVYQVQSLLGVGGMGEVYRARDTKLGREVAIKILPQELARDRDRLARFEREARMLASLNHPNIAAIYGLEDGQEARVGPFIVMELVEGETLADGLARSEDRALRDSSGRDRPSGRSIAVGDALGIAKQIADALDAAHERGIVHRDLKPANIKITPDGVVKVLDFGLAKAVAGETGGDLTQLPTETIEGTRAGVILGTAAYMSPEQARGQNVDKRTDIWAFGCVLYEVLTGRRAFPGATMSDSIAAILERDPDWSALPVATPTLIIRLLRRCLEKDVRRRARDIGDVRAELDDLSGAGGVATDSSPRALRRISRSHWFAAASALAAAIAIAAALWSLGARSRGATDPPTTHLLVDVQPATALLGAHPLERSVFGRWRPSRTAMALSPDGRTIAFTAHRDGKEQLYVRSLQRAEADAIVGTEGADGPFFSPDGAWVGFWAAGAIRKVPAGGGPIVKLCDATPLYGADWTTDGQIVFSQNGSISVVPANGGASKELTKRAADQGEARYVLPRLLPGGKWLMFTVLPTINDWQTTRVVAQSLETGDRKVLLEGAADARYVPTGHIVHMRLGDLDAARFDVERVAVTGGEVTVVHGVMQSVNSTVPIALDTGSGQYAFSESGTLVYATGGVHADERGSLEWIRRDGLHEPITTGPSQPYFLPRLSPNGQQIAVGTLGLNDHNLWRYNLGDKSLTRLTVEGLAEHALWSPDGARLAFVSSSKGSYNLFWMKADGAGTPERLTDAGGEFPGQWLPDGRSLVFSRGGDIGVLSVDDPQHARMLVATRFNERIPDLSPDGRWLAYVSNESGSDEIYVRSFLDLGNKRRVSVDGGTEPAWSRNGKKLVFIARHPNVSGETVEMIETDVTSGPTFSIGPPHTLFPLDSAHYTGASQARSFDITPDASRFLFVHEEFAPEPAAALIYFVQNWFSELQARVSGK